jgi:hypothetical protein
MRRLERFLLALLSRTGRVYGVTASSAVDILVDGYEADRRVVLIVLDRGPR